MTDIKIIFRLFILLLLAAPIKVFSQINPDGTSAAYKHDFEYGFALHTHGFVLSTRYTKHKNYIRGRQYEFEWVGAMQNFREYTYRNTGARAFKFGKENELSIFRVTYGGQKIIADFESAMSIRVNLHYSAGPNVAFLKPIYYLVTDQSNNKMEEVKFDPTQHFYPNQFIGAAKWTKGLSELQVRPGITGKVALSFQWGRQDNQFKALETGLMVDLYGQRLPVMAFTQNNYVFINLYAAFLIGNRW